MVLVSRMRMKTLKGMKLIVMIVTKMSMMLVQVLQLMIMNEKIVNA